MDLCQLFIMLPDNKVREYSYIRCPNFAAHLTTIIHEMSTNNQINPPRQRATNNSNLEQNRSYSSYCSSCLARRRYSPYHLDRNYVCECSYYSGRRQEDRRHIIQPNYNSEQDERRCRQEEEIQQYQTGNDLEIRNNIAAALRNNMNNSDPDEHISRETSREPPRTLIDPMQMVRNRARTNTQPRRQTAHIVTDNTVTSARLNSTGISFGDAMNAFSRHTGGPPTMQQIVTEPRPNENEASDSDADLDADVDTTSDRWMPPGDHLNSVDELNEGSNDPSPETHRLQPGDGGWVNFPTAEGFFDALRSIRADLAAGTGGTSMGMTERVTVVRHDAPVNGNLDGMYIDPETGHEHRRINGVWRDITQEMQRRQPQNPHPVVFDVATHRAFYYDGANYVPLTIDAAPNPQETHNYMTNALLNNLNTTHNRTENTLNDTLGQAVSPIRGKHNNRQEQLTENPNTNQVIGNNQNNMLARHGINMQTIPNIPTPGTLPTSTAARTAITVPGIPTMGVNQRVPAVPTIQPPPNQTQTQTARINPTIARASFERTAAQLGGQNVPVLPLPGPPNGRVHAVPMVQTGTTVNHVAVVPPLANVPMVPQLNLNPLNLRPLNMVVSPPRREQPTIELPRTNPYIRLPRTVIDAIAAERDIHLAGTQQEKANQLFEYDHIMPDWLQSIMTATIETFQVLVGTKLYVFGAIHGVDYSELGGMANRDIVYYTRVSIILNDRNHPGRGILPGLVNGLNRNLLEIFGNKLQIPRNNLRFISTPELRTAVLTGNTDHIQNEAITRVAQRYHMLTTHKYSDLLGQLYNVDGDENAWVTVSRAQPHPMEAVIISLDDFTPGQIISTFGMAVPLSHANNLDRYIRANIVSYSKILTRGVMDPIPLDVTIYMSAHDLGEYVGKLTDNEIFTNIGVYVPYNSRTELVMNTINSLTHQRFMYPSVRALTRSHNKETVMGTDITDVNTFMVCYGTALKYHTYELGELVAAFYRDDHTRAMEFRHPENPMMKFTTNDVEGLMQLLRCFTPTDEIIALLNRIDEGIIDAREKIEFDDTARRQLNGFSKPIQELIREYLRQIFHIGMYMRRWAGPGHPFPLTEEATKAKELPDERVTHQLGIGIELLKQMGDLAKNFCLSLKICQYNRTGTIEHGAATFNHEWNQVVKGEQCIRMASTKFIGTGFHYLRALYRETIPGMDVKALDRIV